MQNARSFVRMYIFWWRQNKSLKNVFSWQQTSFFPPLLCTRPPTPTPPSPRLLFFNWSDIATKEQKCSEDAFYRYRALPAVWWIKGCSRSPGRAARSTQVTKVFKETSSVKVSLWDYCKNEVVHEVGLFSEAMVSVFPHTYRDIVFTWASFIIFFSSTSDRMLGFQPLLEKRSPCCMWSACWMCNHRPVQPFSWSRTGPVAEPSWPAASSAPHCRQYPPVFNKGGGWESVYVCAYNTCTSLP